MMTFDDAMLAEVSEVDARLELRRHGIDDPDDIGDALDSARVAGGMISARDLLHWLGY